jgi:hypothetical protein
VTIRRAATILIAFSASAALPAQGPKALSPSAHDNEVAGIDSAQTDPSPPPRVATGVVVPAVLVALEGDAAGGSTISSLNAPFANGNGEVGFTGGLDNSDVFVWFDDGVTWLNSDHGGGVLTGAEGTMGVSDVGGFIYSPSLDGNDSVWTDAGLLLQEGEQAPDFPAGTVNIFNSRPTMTPGGRSYWIAGFNESGGTSTEGRMLYTSPDSTAASTTVVLRSDDLIGGFTIDRPSGVDFDYDLSSDDAHHIHVLLMDTGSTTDDGFVYVDGDLVARETDPSGDGDNWDNFDAVAVNDSGDYLFSGDTDGATASDEFIAYNGVIALREGAVVAGIPLTGASVQALDLSNDGRSVFTWNTTDTEALFGACTASSPTHARLLLQVGDALDLDGDEIADGTVTDLNASTVIGPGLTVTDQGMVYLEIDFDPGAGEIEAVIGLELGCDIFDDGFESGNTSAWPTTIP